MVRAGWSPSVRLFEAAACAVPIISDDWPGLSELFAPGRDLLVSRSAEETLRIVRDLPEEERRAIGERARARVLGGHTAAHRARQVEEDIIAARDRLKAQGARVLGDGEPKMGAHGKPILFLHPKDFLGTLIELEEA